MVKNIWIFVFSMFLLTSCRKTGIESPCGEQIDLQLKSNDGFIIGSSGGFSGAGLGIFKIKNGQLFAVKPKGDSLLSNERFVVANNFTKNFPKSMKVNPNQNWTGHCNDTFLFYVEIQSADGAKQLWGYDSCPETVAPNYAHCYFKKIITDLFKS